MPKILVFGTGGVGSVHAWVFEKAGAQVTAVCRSNYEQVKEHGISISSKLFGQVHGRPTAVRSVSEAVEKGLGPFDYIHVASKVSPGQSELIQDAVSLGTAIVLAQNGIGIEDEYKVRFPQNAIISAVVYLPTTQTKPGFVTMGALDLLQVGLYPSPAKASPKPSSAAAAKQQAQLKRYADLYAKGGGRINIYEDVQTVRWIKLAVNASWNPICALTGCDDANYLRSSGPPPSDWWPPDPQSFNSLSEVYAVQKEVALVAEAAGYPGVVTDEAIREQVSRPVANLEKGGNVPSMLQDVRGGRKLEIEGILGNVVGIAERCGIGEKVPRLRLLRALARGLDFSIRQDERWRPLA